MPSIYGSGVQSADTPAVAVALESEAQVCMVLPQDWSAGVCRVAAAFESRACAGLMRVAIPVHRGAAEAPYWPVCSNFFSRDLQ